MNKLLLVFVFAVFQTAYAAQAGSYERLDKEDDGPKLSAAELPYTRAEPTAPADVVWYDGTIDNFSGIEHLVIDKNGVGTHYFSFCENDQDSTTHPYVACQLDASYDTYGLIQTYWSGTADSNQVAWIWDTGGLHAFTITGAFTDPHAVQFESKSRVITHETRMPYPRPTLQFMSDVNATCTYKSVDANTVAEDCVMAFKSYSKDSNGEDSNGTGKTSHNMHYWWPKFGIFLGKAPHDLMDVRVGNGPWQSQIDAKSLTADQRAQALALFARGFDLFKANDFTGAVTLLTMGLKIDQTNAKAWAALGDVHRAAFKANLIYGDAYSAIRSYQRVIDLDPTSVEAALATNYLTELGIKYEDLGTAPGVARLGFERKLT